MSGKVKKQQSNSKSRPCAGRLYADQAAVLERLYETRDHALEWVAELVGDKDTKGIGAATMALNQISERIEKVEARAGVHTDSDSTFTWTPYEPDVE